MALISNPASLSSIRTAFNAEGYGISTSLFAYRQGGGIVPNTAAFNAIGAGTADDPLRLSQFSGFNVLPPYIDTQTVTVGFLQVKGINIYGYIGSSFGSISDGTFNPISNAAIQSIAYYEQSTTLVFRLTGTFSDSGWTSVDIAGTTITRNSASQFTNTNNQTQWAWTGLSNPFGTTVGATKVCNFL